MARQLIGKKYKDMPDRYKDRISKEEFQGRRSAQSRAATIAKANELTRGGTRYKDLERADRRDIRKSGITKADYREQRDLANRDIYDVENLEDIDLRMGGAGGAVGRGSKNVFGRGRNTLDAGDDKYGRSKARFSKKNMLAAARARDEEGNKRFTKEEIIDFAENTVTRDFGEGTGGYGGAAQRLLDKWKGGIIESERENPSRPVEETPQDTDTPSNPGPPGTAPGIDELPPIIESDFPTNQIASQGDVEQTLIGSDVYGDLIGNQIIQKNYGAGIGDPNESAMGLSQAYIDSMEDNFNEYSGPSQGMKITAMRNQMADEKGTSDLFNNLYTFAGKTTNDFYNRGDVYESYAYGPPSRRVGYNWEMNYGEPFDGMSEGEKESIDYLKDLASAS